MNDEQVAALMKEIRLLRHGLAAVGALVAIVGMIAITANVERSQTNDKLTLLTDATITHTKATLQQTQVLMQQVKLSGGLPK